MECICQCTVAYIYIDRYIHTYINWAIPRMFSWGTVQQQQQQRRQQQQQQRRQQHPPQTRLLRGSALFMFSSYAAFMKRLLSSTARSLSSFRRKRIHRWMAWLPDHLSVLRIGMVALCRPPLCSLLVIDTHGRRQGLSRDLLKNYFFYFCIHVFVFLFIVIQAILAGLNTNHFDDWYGYPGSRNSFIFISGG